MKPRELPSIDELLELFVVDLILGTLQDPVKWNYINLVNGMACRQKERVG